MRLVVLVLLLTGLGCGRIGVGGGGPEDEALPIVPSNGVQFPEGVALGALVLDRDVVVSTDDGSILDMTSGQVLRPAGPGLLGGVWFETRDNLGVFAVASLETTRAVTFRGARAVVFLVESHALIRAVWYARGGALITVPGPGGGAGGTNAFHPAEGCGAGMAGTAPDVVITGNDSDGGGAGGAFGTAGAGGSPNPRSGPSSVPCGNAMLEPLVGGSGGGAGGAYECLVIGGAGGGGGGAVQITSAGTLEIFGVIDVTGGGGENGRTGPPQGGDDWGGGGGGGAGGAILLEAPIVTMHGVLSANGGAGGGDVGIGAAERGTLSTAPATGGDGVIDGGDGCTAISPARPGNPITGGRDAAGGGGGCGRIVIRTDAPDLAGVITPAATVAAPHRRR